MHHSIQGKLLLHETWHNMRVRLHPRKNHLCNHAMPSQDSVWTFAGVPVFRSYKTIPSFTTFLAKSLILLMLYTSIDKSSEYWMTKSATILYIEFEMFCSTSVITKISMSLLMVSTPLATDPNNVIETISSPDCLRISSENFCAISFLFMLFSCFVNIMRLSIVLYLH